jgi:hypothetical protein
MGGRDVSQSLLGATLTPNQLMTTTCANPASGHSAVIGTSTSAASPGMELDGIKLYFHGLSESAVIPRACWHLGQNGLFHTQLDHVDPHGRRSKAWDDDELDAANAYVHSAETNKGARMVEVWADGNGSWGTEEGIDRYARVGDGYAPFTAAGARSDASTVDPELFDVAYRMGLLARAVYFDKDKGGNASEQRTTRDSYLVPAGFVEKAYRQEVPRRESAEALVALSTDGEIIVLSLAGTDFRYDPTDIEANTDVQLVSTEHPALKAICNSLSHGCRVHDGYDDYTRNVWNDRSAGSVYNTVKSLYAQLAPSGNKRQLWITGHSLGGSMAQLMAAFYQAESEIDASVPSVTKVVAFGSPMLGDAGFVSTYESRLGLLERTQRWAHVDDPGPRLPPARFVGTDNSAYRHAGRVHLLSGARGTGNPAVAKLETLYSAINPVQFDGVINANSVLEAFTEGDGSAHAAEEVYIHMLRTFVDCDSTYAGSEGCKSW